VPAKGETLAVGKWSGTIDAVEARKVKTLRIKKMKNEK
jgi:CBS domain containing-hemolysin-like protein